MDALQQVLLSAAGAALQELLYWYQLQGRLSSADVKRLKSRFYWVLVVLVVLASGLGGWAWFSKGNGSPSAWDCLLVGAAFPALFKTGVGAVAARKAPQLGTKLNPQRTPARELQTFVWAYLGLPT